MLVPEYEKIKLAAVKKYYQAATKLKKDRWDRRVTRALPGRYQIKRFNPEKAIPQNFT